MTRPEAGPEGTAPPLPSQVGRTWLVTGATHGIGREVATAAAAAGARLVLPVRDVDRGRRVADTLPSQTHVVALDLSDLESVRRGAAEVLALGVDVDVLVNNAGTVAPARRESPDGFELLLATNLLGPFALTNLLQDRLADRIVVVGSDAHKRFRLDLADPHFHARRWSIADAYAQSKLGDMLWGLELGRRTRARGLTVQLAHPGWAMTNLQNATGIGVLDAGISAVCSLFAQPAAAGAQPVLVAATADLPPTSYVGPDRLGGLRGAPTLVGRSRAASDPDLARRLWDWAAITTGTDLT